MRIALIGSALDFAEKGKVRRLFKSTRQLADDLISAGELLPERVLEMEHLYPKWVVGFWMREAALSSAFQKWSGAASSRVIPEPKPETQLPRRHPL
jgi:hypothetical protein